MSCRPSQRKSESELRFESLDTKPPVNPVDIVWRITCPVLLIAGADNPVWPAGCRDELDGRLGQWGVDHVIRTYPRAGHAFCSRGKVFHHVAAEPEVAAWSDAAVFLREKLP